MMFQGLRGSYTAQPLIFDERIVSMKQYIVDAFTDKVFSGNPAAICILEKWIPDELMCSIAAENNLSETAFAVKEQ